VGGPMIAHKQRLRALSVGKCKSPGKGLNRG
jgi:hypothetical protein